MAELDACPMHQRGTCTSAPVIYKALPHTCTALALQLVQHQHSNKRLTITPSYNQIALHLFVYETPSKIGLSTIRRNTIFFIHVKHVLPKNGTLNIFASDSPPPLENIFVHS